MAWSIKGTYFENRPCNMVCPCTTSGMSMPADYDRCTVVLAFHIDEGDVNGVDVSGLNVAVLADTPPLMTDGNWKLGMFMDAAASKEQAEAVGGVFGGALGGPMAAVAPLVGEMLGMETVAMEYVDDGRRHSIRAGDLLDIEIEDFVPPGSPTGEVSMLTGIALPAASTVTIARSTRSRINAFGYDLNQDGKNGHSAPFAWSS
jgi:hypothetical protein